MLLGGLTGCALPPIEGDVESTPASIRKKSMTGCVSEFLGQDVSPVDSLHICSQIYSRWEPTTTDTIKPVNKGGKQ